MPSKISRTLFYLVLAIGLVTLVAFPGSHPIYILDEARNAEAAREMFVSGDWIVPTFNGQLRTDKPPLHYFFMIAGFKLFGTTALGARFFSTICGMATLLLIFFQVLNGKAFQWLRGPP
jgi:4-amino-4-deoxy-L-arabinose transferase-like glycosyltransferase